VVPFINIFHGYVHYASVRLGNSVLLFIPNFAVAENFVVLFDEAPIFSICCLSHVNGETIRLRVIVDDLRF
jgi:hypothetical protein